MKRKQGYNSTIQKGDKFLARLTHAPSYMAPFQPVMEDPKHVGRMLISNLVKDLIRIDHNNMVKVIKRFRDCFDERLGWCQVAKTVLDNMESWSTQSIYTRKKLAAEARHLLVQVNSKASLAEEHKIGSNPAFKEHAVQKTRDAMNRLLKKEQSEGQKI